MFITKKKHVEIVRGIESELDKTLAELADEKEKASFYRRANEDLQTELYHVNKHADELNAVVTKYKVNYPFNVGDTVYQIQLRSKRGRFTKGKASRAHSTVVPVVVDKKNYFKLRDVFGLEVFDSEDKANTCLDGLCEE